MFYYRGVALLPGMLLVLSLTAVAVGLGVLLPLLGAAVFGILLGIAVRWRMGLHARYEAGVRFASRQVLQWSIVGLGLCLPVAQVAKTGLDSLSVSLVTISAAFLSALCLGRLLGIPPRLCVLIGTGTAICGGSAIAAIVPVLQPEEHETAFSLSTIFLFNIAAVLLFPLLGHGLGLSDRGFGLWAGTAINDTSSVVAAGYAWSQAAGEYATVVKLTRAMLIVPVTLLIGGWVSLRRQNGGRVDVRALGRSIPWFIVWFVVASALGQYLPADVRHAASTLAPWMVTAALAAIGLSTDLEKMRQTGCKPIVLGLGVWISVACTSLLLQALTARW